MTIRLTTNILFIAVIALYNPITCISTKGSTTNASQMKFKIKKLLNSEKGNPLAQKENLKLLRSFASIAKTDQQILMDKAALYLDQTLKDLVGNFKKRYVSQKGSASRKNVGNLAQAKAKSKGKSKQVPIRS